MKKNIETTGIKTLRWGAKLVTAGLLTVPGWLPKVTGEAAALAEALPGGWTTVYLIAALELVAVALILIQRTAVAGAMLAVTLMLGATASHVVGPVGLEGDFFGVFIAALITLAAAATATALEWRRNSPAMSWPHFCKTPMRCKQTM